MKKLLTILALTFLVSAFALPKLFIWAATPGEERQALEDQLRQIEEQISQYETAIRQTEQEKKTLQNKITLLKNQIKKLELQISQSNLVIADLTLQIVDTESSIEKTSLKIDESKARLAAILQTVYEEDQRPLIEILLAEGISDFFDNLVALESLNTKNQELLENIKALKLSLEEQKKALDEEKESLQKQVAVQTLQKQENERNKKDQEYYLQLTEAEYQKQLAEKDNAEKQAQAIRSRIFDLIGVPQAPTFGEALEIAKFVSAQTGIRPALLLAVLTQESNIGKNVGQCFLVNYQTGAGVRAATGVSQTKVMAPTRDVPHFLNITAELGRDPKNTPVSCPMKDSAGNPVGWGGAMGPSQFIPSTWVLYKEKLKNITGKAADPWNIKDAFLATGVYLNDLGGQKNEFRAVMQYFSGSSWSAWEEFYGRSVLAIAAQYEKDIKEIE